MLVSLDRGSLDRGSLDTGLRFAVNHGLTGPCERPGRATALLMMLAARAVGPAQAAAGPAANWTGYYVLVRGKVPAGLRPVISPNYPEVILAHLKPWARAKLELATRPGSVVRRVPQKDMPSKNSP